MPLNLCNHTGMNKGNDMTITTAFTDALESMQEFYFEMNPDIMAYDYVAEVAECGSFVHNNDAWNMFYDAWENSPPDFSTFYYEHQTSTTSVHP